MNQIFANNAVGVLASSIDSSATTLSLNTGYTLPDPGANWYYCTAVLITEGAETAWEIIKVTAKSGDSLTIERAQDGTTARSWAAGTVLELRPTAELLNTLASASDYAISYTGANGIEIDATLNTSTDATVQIGLASNVSKVDAAETFTGHKTLTGYTESGATLTISSGVLNLPLDGKIYAVSVTEAITSITTSAAPTAPLCGSAIVYLTQDATGHAVAIPAAWYWADATVTDIDATASAMTRLTLVTDPSGNIHADAEVRGVPA